MRLDDKIDVWVNSAFKQRREGYPFYGHGLIKFAEWTRKNGFQKKESAEFQTTTIPCPVVAFVEEKIREDNVTLTITGTVAEENTTESVTQGDNTFTKQLYTTSSTTESITWEVPRFTRKNAVFFLSGLGNKIYEITNITDNIINPESGGKISFFGLASEGSKVLYYLGMNKIHNLIQEILRGIWQAPTKCPYCGGTGFFQGFSCPQCTTYGYSGYNATKGIQIDKGYDVGVTRPKYSSYPLTEAQNEVVNKFVNKCWTQKWWVTPTVSEIKRMFAHFYNVGENEVYITERYHLQMPHWEVEVPIEGAIGSPFDAGDTDLMRYIAESITPAGVTVFIGFYDIVVLAEITTTCEAFTPDIWDSSYIGNWYGRWNFRYPWHNGWSNAQNNFETGCSGVLLSGSGVSIAHPNDRFRHVLQVSGVDAYAESGFACQSSGSFEYWCHPMTASWRCEFINSSCSGAQGTGFWIGYNQSSEGFENSAGIVKKMCTDNDAYLRIRFDCLNDNYQFYINKNLEASGTFATGVEHFDKIKFRNTTSGVSYYDNMTSNWTTGFEIGDSWQTLYPWGWGHCHQNNVSGVSGLYENYFRKGIPFNV